MMEFLAANFNLPTIIVAVIVFGGVGWITWHSHKHGGGCSGCSGHQTGGAGAAAKAAAMAAAAVAAAVTEH